MVQGIFGGCECFWTLRTIWFLAPAWAEIVSEKLVDWRDFKLVWIKNVVRICLKKINEVSRISWFSRHDAGSAGVGNPGVAADRLRGLRSPVVPGLIRSTNWSRSDGKSDWNCSTWPNKSERTNWPQQARTSFPFLGAWTFLVSDGSRFELNKPFV